MERDNGIAIDIVNIRTVVVHAVIRSRYRQEVPCLDARSGAGLPQRGYIQYIIASSSSCDNGIFLRTVVGDILYIFQKKK